MSKSLHIASFPALRENANDLSVHLAAMTRRQMLQASGLGFGSLVLTCLLHDDGLASEPLASASADLRPRRSHFPARAKAVIMLMQNGGPSQMDLFDSKPELAKFTGKVHA